MRLEKTKNTIRNIKTGFITRIVMILLPFAARTAFIYTLGIEYLGLNSLFTSILSVLSLSELGVGSAMVYSMYKPLAEGDDATICALMNLYRKCYYAIGGFIGVAGLLLIPFLPKLINGAIPEGINLYALYLINLCSSVVTYFLFDYKNCILEVYQRNDIQNKLLLTTSILQYVLQILILFFVRNYYCYLIVTPILSISKDCVTAFIVNKKYSQYTPKGNVSKDMIKSITQKIFGLVMYKVGNVVLNSFDNIVITAFIGLKTVAIYGNYYYIITALFGFLHIFSGSMVAGVGNSVVTDSVEKNYRDFNKFLMMHLWIVGWCAITLFCLYQHFMNMWVGSELMFTNITMFLLVMLFYVWRIGDIVGVYKEAQGMWYEDRFRPLIGAFVNLGINLILVRIIGINGIVLSSIISICTVTFPSAAIILFKTYFKRSSAPFFAFQLKHALLTLAIGAGTYYLTCLVHNGGLLGLIIKGGICVVFPNVLYLLYYHKNDNFNDAKRIALTVLRRR